MAKLTAMAIVEDVSLADQRWHGVEAICVRLICALLVTTLALPGWLGGDNARADDATTEDPEMEGPTEISYALRDCRAGLGMFVVPPEHAQAQLPPGYETRDASTISPLPTDAGNALIALGAFKCESATWGGDRLDWGLLGIVVKPPGRPEYAPDPVDFELYVLRYYTDSATQATALAAMGYPIALTTMTVSDVSLPAQPLAATEAIDGDGALFSFQTAASPAERRVTPRMRHRHESSEGLVVWTFQADSIERLGRTLECKLRAGSEVAVALGRVDCFGIAPPTLLQKSAAFDATLRFFPSQDGSP